MSNNKQDVNRQIIPQDKTSQLGQSYLSILNRPGVAPPYTQETMDQYKQWQELCNVAMALSSGNMGLHQNEVEEGSEKPPKEKTTGSRSFQKAQKEKKDKRKGK